jgi:undecaprenyl-diphosphatase
MINLDKTLYKAMNRFADRTHWAHAIARTYAKDGIALFAVLLVVGWWVGRNSTNPVGGVAKAGWAGASALLALAINQPLGAAIDRARPYTTIPNMHLLVDKTTDFSFASDHATVAGAVAAGLFLLSRRVGIVAVAAAVLMAFARVYVGAHYPGDVLAGLALGGVIAVTLSGLARRVLEPIVTMLSNTPLRPLITGETSHRQTQ